MSRHSKVWLELKQLGTFSYKIRSKKYSDRGPDPEKHKQHVPLVFMLSEIKQNKLYSHWLIQGGRSEILEKSRHSETWIP